MINLSFFIVHLQIGLVSADVAAYIPSDNKRSLLGKNAMVASEVVPSVDHMTVSSIEETY